MDDLGSKGLFTAILVALVSVHVQKFFTDRELVIRLPASVPPIVSQSFLSLSPLFFLVVFFWLVRFVLGVDHQPDRADGVHAARVRPQHAAWHSGLCQPRYGAVVRRHQWRQRRRRYRRADLPPVPVGQRGRDDRRAAAAVCDGLRVLHDIRQRRRNRCNDCARAAAGRIAGTRLPEDQPDVASDADVPDQRADLLRPADRPESRLHDSLRPQCAAS